MREDDKIAASLSACGANDHASELEPISCFAHSTSSGLVIRSESLGRGSQIREKCWFAQIDDVFDLDVERMEGEGAPLRHRGESAAS